MYRKKEILEKLKEYRNILITGGAGFIGGAIVRRLLKETDNHIYNLDKIGYASDQTSIENLIKEKNIDAEKRYTLLKANLSNEKEIQEAIEISQPDIVIHLAAESHVDKSIDGPKIFLESNVLGTYNLLQACTSYFLDLSKEKQSLFRFHHVSTDEVFGSLGDKGSFNETSKYSPNNPYSASKASSDHFVNAWHKTYKLPVMITNCSNNYGPWQYPEKLIPLAIINGYKNKPIPMYGNGLNIRDWLFVEDHIDALLTVAMLGNIGERYCIGGSAESTNLGVLKLICNQLDKIIPKSFSHFELIMTEKDRKGHDYRYSINPYKIKKNLGWLPSRSLEEGINETVLWYIKNIDWCIKKG